MNSSELLARIAIESLRAHARRPEPRRDEACREPAERLALLNAILLRDEAVASAHATRPPPSARRRTRL